jgi:hypothetical protein
VTAIGVIGGYGSVGRATVAQLRAWGLGPIVVAGRNPAKADVVVDVNDSTELARYCGSLRLVLNCTGSAPSTRAAMAETAAVCGVPYVDPGGDEPLHEVLSGSDQPVPVVLSAGMWPGLTALLPRELAVKGGGGRLVCCVGGLDRFSLAAAADYLTAVHSSAGGAFAAWRDGRVERAGIPVLNGKVPYFAEQASGVPYLSPEMERLARRLDLAELVFYVVFPGSRLRATLVATRPGSVDAEAVVRASELDLFGRSPYQQLVCQLRDDPATPTIVLSGKGSSELTGAIAAMTGLAVLEGAVPPGTHFAADVLDPAWAKEKLRTADAVTGFRMFDATPVASPSAASPGLLGTGVEEGTI